MQFVERVPPNVQLVNGIKTLYSAPTVVLSHLPVCTFVVNGLNLRLRTLPPPPFTVWCSRLVRFRSHLVICRVTATIRLRHMTMLQALPRTLLSGLVSLGRTGAIGRCPPPWLVQLPRVPVFTGLGWHSVRIVSTLLNELGPTECSSVCTGLLLSRKMLRALL